VECATDTGVLFLEKRDFEALLGGAAGGGGAGGSSLKEDMHRRAEARQHARMSKVRHTVTVTRSPM
jgi:hypothetical protein